LQHGTESGARRWLDGLALWLAEGAARAPRATLAAILCLCILGGLAATRLGVDTDSSRMLAPDLPFQERAHALNEAFPEVKNTIVAVVRGGHGDAVDWAAGELAARLRGADGVASVFAPSADPFLVSHGLLYDDLSTLEVRLSRISQSANLLAELRANRTFPGFLNALGGAVDLASKADIDPKGLAPVLRETARVVEAGGTLPFDWQAAMADSPREGPAIRVVSLRPEFDYARLNPARPAIDAFFMQVRRRLSLLERPIATASNNRRIWHGYSAYNPRSIVKLLEMFRVFYNYVLVGADKQTPAMRLGLAKGRVSIEDIVYFQP